MNKYEQYLSQQTEPEPDLCVGMILCWECVQRWFQPNVDRGNTWLQRAEQQPYRAVEDYHLGDALDDREPDCGHPSTRGITT